MNQPRPTSERELRLASRLEAMAELLGWFDQTWPSGDPGDPQELLRLQAQTALVEAFSNAVRHAHAPLDPVPDVVVRWRADGSGFCLEVVDQGEPFRSEDQFPALREELACGEAHPSQRDHHWGLLMFVRLCDQHGWQISSQQPEQGGNILQLSHPWAED